MLLLPATSGAHGTFHEMMDELATEIAAQPTNATLLIRRAFIEAEHDDWKAALVSLEQASRLGAEEGDLMFPRARALAAGKYWEEAKAELDRFFSTHEPTAPAHMQRARVLMQMGNKKAALSDYRESLRLTVRPEPELVIEVADALAAQTLSNEALQVIEHGIGVLGNVPQLVLKAMELELATQRFDAAIARTDVMAKLMPRAEPWMARRASLLAQSGRTDESCREWLRLRAHILALPNLDRGSHSMSKLLEQANQAIAALSSELPSQPQTQKP